jgi:TolB-like protein/Tfp pilus assembly protein PilF
MSEFFLRLKERKLVQWALAYIAAAFALLQGIDIVANRFDWPQQAIRFVILAMIVGFLVTLVLAWYHGERGAQRVTGTELLILAVLLAIGGGFLWRFADGAHESVVSAAASPPAQASLVDTPLASAVSERSIAILPFENLSSEPENAYFTDGIHDEILTRLAKVADLKVISRTSTQRFKSSPDNLPEIARQLGVVHVLAGSVRRAGERVRVNVQLINAATDAHLWAETYDRELTDIFAVESEIAKTVADTLRAKLTRREAEAIKARPTENKVAHDLYLRGRYFWFKRTAEDLEKAAASFQRAIEVDQNYALAYVGVADALVLMPAYGGRKPQAAYPEAKAAAQKAIALDPTLAEAHASFGKALWNYDFDFAQSLREFETALELNPNYATAHHWYGNSPLASLGRFEQAIDAVRRAVELDPLSVIFNADLGGTLMLARRYDEALEQLRRTLELDPAFGYTHYHLGLVFELTGDLESAIAAYEKARQLGNDPMPTAYLAHAYARSGRRDEALRLERELTDLATRRYVPTFAFALIALGLDDNAKALELLEQAFEARESRFVAYLNVDPFFDRVRTDARFVRLVGRVLAKK